MREALLIARREYVERIRSKAFRVSTLLIPIIFGLIFSIAAFSAKLTGGPKHLCVGVERSNTGRERAGRVAGAARGWKQKRASFAIERGGEGPGN